MLIKTAYEPKNIDDYEPFLPDGYMDALKAEAGKLAGKKIVHINATPVGGGVAEMLKSFVPLEKSLGLDSEWYCIAGDEKFFGITKKMHNALQGSPDGLTEEEKEYYLEYSKKMAEDVEAAKADILVIHDPQPLAVIRFLKKKIPSIFRIHIDLTKPNGDTREFILPFILEYDKVVFSLKEYVLPEVPPEKIFISPPAIDPASPKNIDISPTQYDVILNHTKINLRRPLLVQVSRFDAWKDPLGVLKAYKIVKQEVPEACLALAGIIEAKDDPEALKVYEEVKSAVGDDPDVFLFSNMDDVGDNSIDVFVNALQTAATVVFQKSLREGFGLTVTEAMWKRKAVIGGRAGGIVTQITDGENGFLVDSPEDAADRAILLLKDDERRTFMGQIAHDTVGEHFLITRFLRDEIDIMNAVVQNSQ